MQYRPLGRTGLQLSELGFGASPLGGVFGPVDEEEAIRAVHAAFEMGINFFDVSPFYGLGRAETLLGKALRSLPRNRYILSTKIGRYGADEFDFSYPRAIQSVDQSLERLGTSHFDIVHFHDVEFGNLNEVATDALAGLVSQRWEGKVRLFGVSGLPLKALRTIVERIPGGIDAVLSYCHYTLADDSLLTMLDFLEERHVGVINASPLGMGLLSNQGPPAWHPAPTAIRAACAAAADLCRQRGADISRLALQFALGNPRVTSTLVGMATVQEVRTNVEAVGTEPDAGLLAEVQAILAPIHNQAWPSGRPENN